MKTGSLLSVLVLVALPVPASAQGSPVGTADDLLQSNAMEHAAVLLSPEALAEVESGRIWRGHLAPSGTLDALFEGRIRKGAEGTCVKTVYRLTLSTADGPARGDALVYVRQRKTDELYALAAEMRMTGCLPLSGFIQRDPAYPDRQAYALRTLSEMLDAADQGQVGAHQVICRTDDGPCTDALKTLAGLDLSNLYTIEISSGKKLCDPPIGRTRICYRQPIGENQPFEIEARLRVPQSPRVWILQWIAEDGKELRLNLLQTIVI